VVGHSGPVDNHYSQQTLGAVVRGFVTLGRVAARPAGDAIVLSRRVEREARDRIAHATTRTALAALDAALASAFLEAAVNRAVESRLADETITRIVDETVTRLPDREALWALIDEIAQSPAVMDAITQQGMGFADQVADDVRERSRHADARLERTALRLLRRPPRDADTPQPPQGPGA
jgi:hypothetical protein